jgi:gamma-glutamylcyclotransferase (GGCT)/AIG2-like uncharacterized protein YtfP
MADRLAVYGSLLTGLGARQALGLEAELRVCGPCAIGGALLDLGPYPGLVRSRGRVAGELLELSQPAILAVLDAYEGFDARAPGASLFVRERVRLLEPDADAWVYVYNGSEADGSPVFGGCWRTHLRARER